MGTNNQLNTGPETRTGCKTVFFIIMGSALMVLLMVVIGTAFLGEKGGYYIFFVVFICAITYFIGYYIYVKNKKNA